MLRKLTISLIARPPQRRPAGVAVPDTGCAARRCRYNSPAGAATLEPDRTRCVRAAVADYPSSRVRRHRAGSGSRTLVSAADDRIRVAHDSTAPALPVAAAARNPAAD